MKRYFGLFRNNQSKSEIVHAKSVDTEPAESNPVITDPVAPDHQCLYQTEEKKPRRTRKKSSASDESKESV